MQLRHNAKMHRFLASSVSALLAANAMVLVVGLADDVADSSDGATRTVTLITTADGTQVEVDPSTPEGQWMIAEAERRGDDVVTVPAAEAATTTTAPGAATTVPAADGGEDDLLPDVTVPDVTVPDVTVPDLPVTVPTLPQVTVPQVTVPQVTVPQVTVPPTTVPQVTVPQVTVPPTTVPQVTVPPAPDSGLVDDVADEVEDTVGGVLDQGDDGGLLGGLGGSGL